MNSHLLISKLTHTKHNMLIEIFQPQYIYIYIYIYSGSEAQHATDGLRRPPVIGYKRYYLQYVLLIVYICHKCSN